MKSLKEQGFVTMLDLLGIGKKTEEEIHEEQRQAYLQEINDGIKAAWENRETFYRIDTKGHLYDTKTLVAELTDMGYDCEPLWRCGSVIVRWTLPENKVYYSNRCFAYTKEEWLKRPPYLYQKSPVKLFNEHVKCGRLTKCEI